jgi:large subunit ribosomal protein L7/L12
MSEEEVKQEEAVEAAPAAEEASAPIPAKFKKFVEEIETMTVLELSELVKVFEKKFGVSAAAVAVAGPAAAGAGADEGKSTVNVELTDGGAAKIQVIKVVKEALGLGLKEAKDLVDGAPNMLKENASKEDAEDLKKKIEDAGGKVTFK